MKKSMIVRWLGHVARMTDIRS